MRALVLAAALMAAAPFAAQAQPQPPKPEMVLLPRQVAEAAAQWIAQPNAGNAVQLYAALTACIADNPHGGVTTHMGADQCAAVTEALAAQAKELADAKAPKPTVPTPPVAPAPATPAAP